MTTTETTTDNPVAVGKILPPLARELAENAAEAVGACTRPLAVRRTDPGTGEQTVIALPCGSTREARCLTCARRAARLSRWQAQEGWHLVEEPAIDTAEPTAEQLALLGYRADLEETRAAALETGDQCGVAELDRAIAEADAMLRADGIRGTVTRRTPDGQQHKRRTRSTRRRQDAANLPRKQVQPPDHRAGVRGPGRQDLPPVDLPDADLPSYGPVLSDGSPRNPDRYDYRRAARDAIHFGALVDRFWQNLRRAAGWNVQYFAAVEPQQRGAPHLHAAVRGTLPRKLIREVAAATYHQVWWPPHDEPIYRDGREPIWDATRETSCYVDPDTFAPLPTWDQALDELGDEPAAAPAHVVRFGARLDIQGVLAGSEDAGRCLRYMVKYLTKSIGECHEPDTESAARHVERLTEILRYEPCSPTCANWLRYGVQPKDARPAQVPGQCRGKAHKPHNLGYGGRRCLVSRRWSGRNLSEHRHERREHVMRSLGVVGARPDDATPDGQADRYRWELIKPSDPNGPDRTELLLRSIAEHKRRHEQYERAKQAAAELPATA